MRQSIPPPSIAYLNGISLWYKRKLTQPPTLLPKPVTNALKKQSKSDWVQELIGLLSHNWADIPNSYLQSISDKITGKICNYSYMKKIWDTAWDIWDYRNHTLHATYGLIKTEIITRINTRVIYHFHRGMKGPPIILHFTFKTNIHALTYPHTSPQKFIIVGHQLQHLKMILTQALNKIKSS